MALTKEQIKIMDGITGLDNSNSFTSNPKKQNDNITLSDEQIKRMDEITGLARYEQPKETSLKQQIIEENPEQAKVWQEKGEITPYEAALDASREFNGTYDKVIQRKQTNPEMNAMGKAVSKFLGDNLPSVKKTLKKFLNEEIVNGYNTQSAIDEAHRQADLNARSQDVNFKDYTRRYEISSIDRAGKANYREVDLLDKIGFLEAMREGTIRGTAFGALAEGADDKKLREIKNKIINGESIYQDELDFLNRHHEKEQEKIVRGYSLLGKVGSAAGMSLGISADILAGSFLGELFGLSKIASGAGVNAYKGLRSIDAGKTLSRAVAGVANWGVRSLAGAGITTVANAPYRLYAEYQGRMLNNETELTDSGNLIFKESDEKPATAFFKSLEKLYIMYFTEMGGGEALGAIAKGIGKGAKYAANPVIDNLFKKYPKLESFMLKTSDAFAKRFEEINKLPVIGKSTGWLKSQAHFDGFLEECGEEALEDVLNLVAGTNNEERSLENFAKAIFKTPEEWAVIAGAIIIQGAGLSAANYVIAKNMAKNGKSPEEIKETINSISQNQASEIIDDLIKNNSINIGDDVRLTDADKRRSIEIKNEIKQKLSDVNVPEEEAQRLAVLTGAMYERYGTKNDESRDVFNQYINNLQIKYNLPVNQVLKGGVQYNQDYDNNIEKEFGQTQEELAEMFKADIQNILTENEVDTSEFDIEDVRIYGSYTTGKNKETSDLDVIVQYSGTMREDAAFNLLHDTELTITDKNGVERVVDINPINRETSGTIDEHIQHMNNLNNAKNYNSFEDFVNEFSENMEETPEDYKINNLQDVLNDLGITEDTPLVVNTPTGTVSVRVSSIEHIVNGGDSTLHNPDKSRYKSINRMLAVLERPEIVISDENGKKKYIKLFKGNNKTKSQIAVVYNDVNGDYVYTTIPVTKHKKYILKEVNSGNVIYKKGQTRENISAANNIITDNSENFNPDVLFQAVNIAGAESNELEDAAQEWQEKGTESKYFKKWFGDSKVVDENGKPLIVYHGSRNNFEVFEHIDGLDSDINSINTKEAFFFVDDDIAADEFAEVQREAQIIRLQAEKHVGSGYNNLAEKQRLNEEIKKQSYNDNIRYNVYLSIQNPVIVNFEGREYSTEEVDDLILDALENGNDGVIIKNIDDVGGVHTQYAVFNPEQIKSVDNRGTFDSENANIYYQPAYNGSPYRFDNFSTEYIGTGEGNQAHGWGLYFAKNKNVSEGYRQRLSKGNDIILYKGESPKYLQFKNTDNVALLEAILYRGKNNVLNHLEKNKPFGDDTNELIDYVKSIDETQLLKVPKGQVYEVDIPENEELLDEDKELIHQPDKVQRAIEEIYADAMKSNNVELTNAIGITGKEIYRGFSKYFGSDKKASEFLNSYGIKGIKYNGYQDGECYVIFDDKAVDILKTYYQETENAEEQKLIAGFTYQEVLDKITKLAIELDNTDNDAVQDEIMTKINILEDAFEAEVHPEKFTQEQITDIMLNAYYVMNDEKIPEKFVESNKKSARTYNDLVKRHKEKKEREEQKYLGYFLKESELKPVIVVMKEKNASTALHEFSHMFLDLLNEMAKVNPDARVQLEAVNKWLNCTGEYTSAQHEKFANNFVAYLYKGKAPNSKLKQVFENFKEWLKSVYKGVSEIPDFELSEEVEQLFSNIFGSDTFFEESRQAAELLKKVKDTVKKQRLEENKYFDDNELDETQKRHKQVSYEILSVATGKSVKYLKTIFETNSNKKSFIKKREAIENLIEQTDDKIYKSGGMRPEWNEFYHDTGVDYESQDVGGGAELAQAALRTILNKSYRSENDIVSELGERVADLAYAVDEADKQYKILIREYRKGNKNIAIAAICDWIDGLGKEIRKDYEDRFVYDCAMIDREINLDKCEKAKRAIIKRALEVERQSLLTKDEQYKEVVKEIIKNLNFLNPYDKARLTSNILDVPNVDMLMSSIDNILDIAKTMEDVRYRKQLETEIHKELQTTKNVRKSGKQTGKYDYRTNKLFEELRQLDKLSQERANEMRLENKRFIDATEKVLDYREKLINKFLSYKAGGRTFADTDLMKELYDEIVKIKLAGKTAKSELELEEKLNNEKDVEELFKILDKKTPAKWTTKLYNECFGNIESTLNLIFNKRIKDKYASEILYAGTKASTWSYEQKKKVIEGIAKIYNVPKWKWDSIPIKYLSEKYTFDEIRRKYDEAGEIIKTRIIPREMTRMDILNAYIQSMNEVGQARLINQFGQETLDMMFDELSVQDVKMAELLMNVVQSNYALINKEYIKRYGIDLPKVSNYFPFTPERMDDVNTYNEYQTQSYSFIKTRSKSEIMAMDFHNPLEIVFSHIENVSKFVFMSESIDRANKLFKNPDIKRAIIYKYGNGGYKTLEQELLNIGNRKQAEVYNGFQKIIDRITSNWCLANVMIKPITGLKQLLSASNYAVDMPYIIWQKGFLNALTNYKETIDYMMNIPYLKARYGSGFSNEALKQEIESSEYATIQSLKNFLTLNIRLGDIGAIIFGGKPYIDYLIKEKRMNEEDAIKQFILSTNRSQQSSEVASLSNLQVNMARSPILKVLTAYRNAQQQYVRLCGDAVISVANGDMTKEQCAKVLFNYGFFQPFIFALATSGSLLRGLLTGDWDDLLDDLKLSIFNLGSDSVAFFGDVYKYAIQRLLATNKFTRRGFDLPIVSEMIDEINKVSKEEVELSDWLHFIGFAAGKLGIGVDVNQNIGNSIIGATSDALDGEYIQAGLRAIGMTEKRAKRITGEE